MVQLFLLFRVVLFVHWILWLEVEVWVFFAHVQVILGFLIVELMGIRVTSLLIAAINTHDLSILVRSHLLTDPVHIDITDHTMVELLFSFLEFFDLFFKLVDVCVTLALAFIAAV